MRERLLKEATKCLQRWMKHKIDWHAELGVAPHMSIDLIRLMDFDIGPIYRKIEKDDVTTTRSSALATSPRWRAAVSRLGALNSEGFCERMLSAAGNVLTEGNTVLDHAEMEI